MKAGTSEKLVSYVRGVGGRIDALRGFYLDRAAEAVVRAHPHELRQPVRELLVSNRFRRSEHPQLRDLTLSQLRELNTSENRRWRARRKQIHGEQAFLAAERARKRAAVV